MACRDNLSDQNIEKHFAQESPAIKRGRAKLLKELKKEKELFTEEALRRKVDEIQKSISRHIHNRIILKDKRIQLFDENENSQKESKKIIEIATRVRELYQL